MDYKEYYRSNAELAIKNGAILLDPDTTYIEDDVVIGAGAKIYPGVFLEGKTVIGEGTLITNGTRIVDSVIGKNNRISNSVILEATIGDDNEIGPYAYFRPGAKVGSRCKVGDFVEVKNSTIEDGALISHLAYIGDGHVGKNANVGCGVVFVNYNGVIKCQTNVEDGAFVGCNCNLIAPVTIGKNAYVAAGSTVTESIPDGAFAISRTKGMTIKENFAKGRYEKVVE